MKIMTRCTENHDEIGLLTNQTVMIFMTTLSYHTYPAIRRQRATVAVGGDHAK